MSTAGPKLVPNAAPTTSQPSPLTRLKEKHGIYHGAEISAALHTLPPANHLIDGLIPPGAVSILVGDSGIGKTPLAYQLALSLAAGLPFLGLPAKPARVLLVDFENSLRDAHWMLEQLRKHLRLDTYPDNFLLWPAHLAPQDDDQKGLLRTVEMRLNKRGINFSVSQVIRTLAPDLVIIDSLRSFNPEMEKDNAAAVWQIKSLRSIAKRRGTALLLIHHVRKQRMRDSGGSISSLEEGAAMDWLLQTAGARALINQTDVRLAVAPPKSRGDNDAIALLLRGHSRTRGEIGPYLLRRVLDSNGDPSGYERVEATTSLLKSPEQETIFLQLAESFVFGDAVRASGHPQRASRLVHDLLRLGLVRKIAHGQYQKCEIAKAA